jgi:hypothetical protein
VTPVIDNGTLCYQSDYWRFLGVRYNTYIHEPVSVFLYNIYRI